MSPWEDIRVREGVREPDLLTLKAYADEAGVSGDDLIDDSVTLPEKLAGAKHLGD